MSNQFNDWQNQRWENNRKVYNEKIKNSKKPPKKNKKRRRDEDNQMGPGFLVLLVIMIAVIGIVGVTFTEKGQAFLKTMNKPPSYVKYEDWDYSHNDSDFANGFDMTAAQEEIEDNTTNKKPSNNKPNQSKINNEFNNVIETPKANGPQDNSLVSIGNDNNSTISGTTTNNKPIYTQVPNTNTNTTTNNTQTQTQITQPPTNTSGSCETIEYVYNENIKAQVGTQRTLFDSTINEILVEINKVREEAGVNPVTLDNTLCDMCAYRSLDMVDRNYYSHDYENISQLRLVMKTWGRNNRHYENLAKVKSSDVAGACIKGWKGSDGHYKAMTNAEVTIVGIGVAKMGDYYYITTIYSN